MITDDERREVAQKLRGLPIDMDGDSLVIDCFALMIIDLLKSCGVEVEDEV